MRESTSYKVFQVINYALISLFIFATLFPFLQIVAESFSSSSMIRGGHVTLIPRGFNIRTYQAIMEDPMFWRNYRNTLVYTAVGVSISMIFTSTTAYALSKKNLMGRSVILFLFTFTMFFSGGLIPHFLLVTVLLGWRDSMLAIVIPGAIGVFNLLIMKTFFEHLPMELEEAAKIDGCSQYGIFFKIVLPLSTALLATMVLFYAVGAWNSWFSAMLFLTDRSLQPVAMFLRNLIAGAAAVTGATAEAAAAAGEGVDQNVGAVAIILTSMPIIMVYPFLQRYFVKGVMIGSIKG